MLIDHDLWAEALQAAQTNQHQLIKYKLSELGEKMMNHLMDQGQYEEAAKACKELLGGNPDLWEAWLLRFAKEGQVKAIVTYLPTDSPRLRQHVYELVLNDFLRNDHDAFLQTLNRWPDDVYNIEHVIDAVQNALKQGESKKLLEALGELHLKKRDYGKTLNIYLRLGRKDVFKLVKDLNLIHTVRDKVRELMTFDKTEAIDLILTNLDKFNNNLDDIVKQLEPEPALQHEFLDSVFKKDITLGAKFHPLQVKLYARFNKDKLLQFLRNSNSYILEDALKVCEEGKHFHEMVFLLNRMGNSNQALSILIKELKDVRQAIAFVEEHKDPQLWEELIKYALNEPTFLAELLENVGAHDVDLRKLIERIKIELEVPKLRDKLIKIFSDCELQKLVMTGCNNILRGDVLELQSRLKRHLQRAVKVDLGTPCALCEQDVFRGRLEPVVLFFCRHAYHTACLDSQRRDKRGVVCVICSKHHLTSQLNELVMRDRSDTPLE